MKGQISSRSWWTCLGAFALAALLPASAGADWFSERFEVHGFITSKAYFRSPNLDLAEDTELASWRTELNLEMSFDVYDGTLFGEYTRIAAYSVVRPIYEPVFDLQDEHFGKGAEPGDFGTSPAFPNNDPFASDSADGDPFPGSGPCIEGEFCRINSDTGSLFQEDRSITLPDAASTFAFLENPPRSVLVPAQTINNTVFFGRVTAPVAARGPQQDRIGDPATGETYLDDFLHAPLRFAFGAETLAGASPVINETAAFGFMGAANAALEASLTPQGQQIARFDPITGADRGPDRLMGKRNPNVPLTTPLNFTGLGDENSLEQAPFDINRTEDELKFECGDNAHPWCFLRELYMEFEWGNTFIRVGRQQVVWGKTDAFRLQDNIMPLDIGYHNVFPDLEERRIPQLALDLIHSFGDVGPLQDVSLEFVWVFDKFLPLQFGQCGEAYAFTASCEGRADSGGHTLFNFSLAEAKEIPWTFENTEPGLRLEWRIPQPSISFSLSAFWAHQDLPVGRFQNHYSTENPNRAVMLFLQGLGLGNLVDLITDPDAGISGPWEEGFDPYAPLQNPDGSLTDVGLANQQLIQFYQGNVQSTCAGLSGDALGACAGNFTIFALPWSASEAVLEYPRVLTLGGSLDYQIPRIDTVLRLEVAYDVDRAIQDTSAFDGVSDSDVLLAAVGIDRSTFIPLVNPNRTAFLSFQTFVEHVLDYEDGRGLGDGMVNYETSVISTAFMQNFWRNDSLVLTNFVAYDWQAQALITGPTLRWIVNQHLFFDVGVNLLWGREREHNIRDLCANGQLDGANCTIFDPTTWRRGNWQTLNAGVRRKAEGPFWAKESFADRFMESRDEFWVGVTWQW